MADHHEPVMAVSVPSPLSAFIPASPSGQSCRTKLDDFAKDKLADGFAQSISDTVKITTSPMPVESTAAKTIKTEEVSSIGSSLQQHISSTATTHNSVELEVGKKFLNHKVPYLTPSSSPAEPSSCTTTLFSSIVTMLSLGAPSMANSEATESIIAHPVDSLLPHVLTPSLPSSETKLENFVASKNILQPTVPPNSQQGPSLNFISEQMKPTADPIPMVIPEFQLGKIDAKKFPARHFDLRSLVIGSWKYETKPAESFASKTSRLKVIFSQKKFIYEFELEDNSSTVMVSKKEKHMASIEVPFSSIVGLSIPKENPHQLLIEVNSSPSTYLGKQELHSSATGCALPTKYDTTNPVDLTDGQILTVPYHQINLGSGCLRGRLEEFDPRFKAMLRTPIVMDPSNRLSLQPLVKPNVKHKKEHKTLSASKRFRKSLSASLSPGGEGICSCTSGCNSQRCKCVKAIGKCSSECKCVFCKNPLNIMANNGVDIDIAKKDNCVMQNIFKINDLQKLMKEGKGKTPCCDVSMPFKNICVGLTKCPECESEYRFSWCSFSFCEDKRRPRNHCAICRRCGHYQDDHCSKCNKCYFAGTSARSFQCPCENRCSFVDSLSLFLNNFVDPTDCTDEE